MGIYNVSAQYHLLLEKTILMKHYLFLGLFVVDIKQAFMELSL